MIHWCGWRTGNARLSGAARLVRLLHMMSGMDSKTRTVAEQALRNAATIGGKAARFLLRGDPRRAYAAETCAVRAARWAFLARPDLKESK